MSNETVEEFTVGKCRVKIEYDADPSSPREWDNLGTMVCWHRRYNLGDEQPKEDAGEYLMNLAREVVSGNYPEALLEKNRNAILDKHYTRLPLYLYDHSGITMSTGSFSCPWDSGQVGFIYVSLDKALKENSLAKGSWETKVGHRNKDGQPEKVTLREYARRVLTQEVETYDEFITGQVYGYVVETDAKDEDGDDIEGEHLDSCWGFYGLEYCKEEARSVAESRSKQIETVELETALAETMP